MKKIFKFFFVFIVVILVLVGAVIGTLYFMIRDKTNDIPYELYSENITLNDEFNNILYSSLEDLSEETSINVGITEEQLNKILFAILKEKYPNYQPVKGGTNKETQVITLADTSLPVLGRRGVELKGAYANYNNDEIRVIAVLNIGGIKSTLNVTIKFTEKDGVYKLQVKRLALGKINVLTKRARRLRAPILDALDLSDDSITAKLADKGLPISFSSDTMTFSFNKSDLPKILEQYLGDSEEDNATMAASLVDILIRNEDLVQLGFYDGAKALTFGVRLATEKLTVNPEREDLPAHVLVNFDTETFIKNKTQSFIFSNLSSDPKLSFTDRDFNRILRDKTNNYEDFKFDFDLPNGSKFTINIKGILIGFSPEEMTIEVIIDINGLVTIMKLTADIENNNSDNVRLVVRDTVTLGEDLGEEIDEFITTSNLFFLELIGENLGNLDIIDYNSETHAFILNSETFNELLNVGGNNDNPPISVDKIKVKDGKLAITIAYNDPDLINMIDNVSNLLNNYLENPNITADDFNIEDPEQAQVVEDLLNNLDDISTTLGEGGNLSPDQIDSLMDNLNNLDDDNTNVFTGSIENGIGDQDLEDLYDEFFGLN